MKFLAKIKTIKKLSENTYYAVNNLVEMFFVEAENKEEVKTQIAEKYPSLFPEGRVYLKTTKQEKQLCYLQIELADSWTSQKLNAKYTCLNCKDSFTGIQYFNLFSRFPLNFNPESGDCYCTSSCKEEYSNREYEEYSNNQSQVNYIYKITEISTGRSYIGKTSNAVFFRWWYHLKHSNSPFGKYLRSKKLSDFRFEVLEELEKDQYSEREVFLKESEYILKYNSIHNGFNEIISNVEAKNPNQLSTKE